MQTRNQKGVTLIELLTVIGIISLLAAISIPAYSMIQKNVSLNNAVKEVIGALKMAQNLAISSQGGTNYGVRLEQNQYILCRNNCSQDVAAYPLNIAGTGTVTFNRLTGTVAGAQSIVIGSGDDQRTIIINNAGKIYE